MVTSFYMPQEYYLNKRYMYVFSHLSCLSKPKINWRYCRPWPANSPILHVTIIGYAKFRIGGIWER